MIDISVIIPTFRRPGLLSEAIQSVLEERSFRLEIIVVDDSPEGSARTVVENEAWQRQARVIYLKLEPPSGGLPALVRNAGWARATGRFVHFLDDDDRVAAGFYRAAIAAFDRHPRRGVVFGRIEPFGAETPAAMSHERAFFSQAAVRARRAARIGSARWLTAYLLFHATVLVNSACMIRREHIAPLGGYDPDLTMNEDVDFYCRAVRRYGFAFLDRVVLHYRITANSLMHGRANNEELVKSYKRMYSRYRETYGKLELLGMKLFARTVLRLL